MQQISCEKERAVTANHEFELCVKDFLGVWVFENEHQTLFKFDQSLEEYFESDALRDFFLISVQPLQELLRHDIIGRHLGRGAEEVYFDKISGDPLFSPLEQKIYNLARRMDSERMDIPFRSVHPFKQTEAGDTADISTYPVDSDQVRYNSGNHFSSRPANESVFDENSRRSRAKSADHLTIIFKRGFLEDRLQDVKDHVFALHQEQEKELQFYVICSRHSAAEGHFGASLVIMDPAFPYFPLRVLVCDTLLKELPQHPRWWPHFISEYSNVFGDAVAEMIEDLSHPLQKVNIKGDHPYRHDWDCPYYVASMTNALADLAILTPALMVNGSLDEIQNAMKGLMPDYYQANQMIKERDEIRLINRLKRWNSGRELIKELLPNITPTSRYEV